MSTARLMDLARNRTLSDVIIPVWLPFAGAILTVLGSLVTLAGLVTRPNTATPEEMMAATGLTTLGILLFVLGSIVQLYVVYKWIDRRNKHFQRSREFFREVAEMLKKMGAGRAERMEHTLREMELEEARKEPIVWIILSLITMGLAFLYVLYFLTRDFYKHSMRETYLAEDVEAGLAELGLSAPPSRFRPLPERNAVIYQILTLIFSPFLIYWVYVLTNDPNNHFREHAVYEDGLISVLEKAAA